jgi:ubiquinol-cytochrome c reductase cytochrome b subunit
MLGEIALWSFVILLLTGTFLALFFVPSMADVVYHGSYVKLDGIRMSEAYQSTLNISFDVRGGLLMRQIHHWAADLFMAALIIHMLRVFFTGAYRKPREINWLIGVGLFTLGLLEGLFGYSLPDDQLSGAGLRIFEGVLQGIPIVGTYLAFFLFGGGFPGNDIMPRMYILHVLLIPGLILALITAHLFIMFHQKHTQMPAKGNTEKNVVGQPFFPYFLAKGGAWFFFIFGALVLLATFAQINPIWLYGPYTPVAISSASQPDFYMGILEGSLRMMPAWEINFLGHTLTLSVLIPAATAGPHLHRRGALAVLRAVGDRGPVVPQHQRPAAERSHADRVGVAAVVFYGVCGPRAPTTSSPTSCRSRCTRSPGSRGSWSSWDPRSAFFITKRICLGLQRKDKETLLHGYESGIIRQLPNGEFIEVHRPVNEEARAVLEAKRPSALMPAPGSEDENGVPSPERPAVRSARPGRGPTAPSPRPSWSRPTAITGTGTYSRIKSSPWNWPGPARLISEPTPSRRAGIFMT